MGVIGLVGLPGTGKTLGAVEIALGDMELGREVYANLRLGTRCAGYIVPVCPVGEDPFCQAGWRSVATHAHESAEWAFVAEDELGEESRRLYGACFRRGRGFVADPRAVVLTSWQQVIAIAQGRDAFGVAHRLELEESGTRDEEGEVIWRARPACRVWDCLGCSRGVTIVLDELNLWAPSRLWQKLGVGVLNRWAYVRKDGLNIVWTAQHEARVDKVVKEVTDYIWSCTALGGVVSVLGAKVHAQVFTRRKWHPAELTDRNRVVESDGAQKLHGPMGISGYQRYWWLGRFGRLAGVSERYDTYEHVAVAAHLAVDAKAAPAAKAAARPRRIA